MITQSSNGYVANENENRQARGLGWFSLTLGLTLMAAPRRIGRAAGVEDQVLLMRVLGLREITTGIGILTRPDPHPWFRARVIGDLMDLSLLGVALVSTRSNKNKARLALAVASVAAVTRLDMQTCRHSRENSKANLSAVRVVRSVIIDRPASELFAFWRNFKNLPRILSHVESVRVLDDRRSHWRMHGPAGTSMEWEAAIVNEHPDEMIAWRSSPESNLQHAGSIRFSPASGNRGTLVRVELKLDPPAGALGLRMAKLFGQSPEKQIAVDLHRFKQLMETGEIARTKGQPTGQRRRLSIKYDQLARA